ncbi:uncharacterized protein SCHCODRAFT_02606624 [Schizophyllum commune H4-8]|uniref:uncharacterized protein n=1 Tax=Schizophyllum commune (strain H4-8 / FGSC 9210) TaxID=578458 RepID=UPI00215E8BD9|nr:uncharacterized protein SCHCODRAFT_02606624 [Schizophyllum commune H4-8]KAI5899970.1 hypothetical protein SCHCODRAFT_02606624 [Schizophyllum commune H4-8]
MSFVPNSVELPALPKAAHSPAGDRVISRQPTPSSGMSVSGSFAKAGSRQSGQEGVMRQRGGCIPCPDGSICYIIPIPCCCCP